MKASITQATQHTQAPSRWHKVYRERVLGLHYRLDQELLLPYFFDSLRAYALELAQLQVPGAAEGALALAQQQGRPLPEFDGSSEDVFFAINQAISQRWGSEVAGALRQGLSRNDLDMTVFRAFARDRALQVLGKLNGLRRELLNLARRHQATLITAYTHYRPAQPSTLGHYFAAVENLLSRDGRRLWAAMQTADSSPLGASALAGNPFPINRGRLAERLGFAGIVENTYDAVSAGDWALEIAQATSGLATSLSRLSHDLLFWAEREGFRVDGSLTQGSSIMPQKRNPVVFEHVRAYIAQMMGATTALQTLNHNTPFGDINDHSTGVIEPLEQLTTTAVAALELMQVTLATGEFMPQVLAEGLGDGSVMASELADVLVMQGNLPLAEAQGRVKALMAALASNGRTLAQADAADFALHLGFDDPALLGALDPRRFLERRAVTGGVSAEAQQAHLQLAHARLYADRRNQILKRRRVRVARARLG